MKKKPYDSTEDTMAHIAKVDGYLNDVAVAIAARGPVHDISKLRGEEKRAFDRLTPLLKDTTFGSPEYKQFLQEMKPAIEHHHRHNRHHPEHHDNGIRGMNLIDITEMLCDWLAASQRHEDGDIFRSVEIRQKKYGFGDELKQVLLNTLRGMKQSADWRLPGIETAGVKEA